MNEYILKILTYFIIYSFLGWVLESFFKTIMEKKPINSGFLHGPFCPIYGVGALIMYFCLQDFKGNFIVVFCLGFVVLSLWEYFVGFLLEKAFNTTYWDYSNKKYNLKGRVCLENSIYWGLLGIIFINYIHPFIENKLTLVNTEILIYINIIVYAWMLIDFVISVIKVRSLDLKLNKLSEITQNLKERIEELKQLNENTNIKTIKAETKETIENKIEELKKSQTRLRRKIYRYTYRIKKAFPTMKSEKITEFLSQKIDIRKTKKEKKQK